MNENVQLKYAFLKPFVPTEGTDKTFVLFEFHGTSLQSTSRPPLNLSIVLDRSGSMSGKPLQYCKEAAIYVLNHLSKTDLLNLVVFDNDVQTIFPPQQVTHKDLLKHKINQIETRGMTNLSGGLIQGCQHLLKADVKQYVNRALILSDGQANRGITDYDQLMKIVEEYQMAGVQISSMGVSEHFNEELMEGIAEHGRGNYYFIDQVEEIPTIFAKELEGLLSVIAQNVHFTIRPKDDVKIKNLYGYRFEESDQSYHMVLGDMYSNEVKSILIECSLPARDIGLQDIFDIEWSFVDVTDGVKDIKCNLNIPIEYTTDILKISSETDTHVDKQVEITKSAKTLEKALELFDDGEIEAGKELLYKQAKQMSEKAVYMNDEELMKESKELYSQLDNFEYSQKRRKELHNQKYRQMKRKKRE
jgi:Ca-activated chloride channel homolog